MAYARLAPLALYLLATSILSGLCINSNGLSSVAKMIDEHPNLCKSDDECMKKGSGNFCARYPNTDIDYGWCFDSDSEALKGFLAMPAAITT
ncbi:albumin-1 isoform X2 [Vigna angularis]|uniref:albumin-1 isoform X2 n=1 Tax=Phaseolus angularis TaxID=3914 RepID=UPI000809E259|nr:albumin-1 isoform X2 [Vigna angularis]